MKLNLLTLIFVFSLLLITQVVALFVQFRLNRRYKGIGYWLLGSCFMALAFIFMPMVTISSLEKIARIANPLLILGHIFIYIGVKKFFNRKIDLWIPISIFTIFNLFYYYYMYIENNIVARTIIISLTIAIVSFMIVYQLLSKKDKGLLSVAKFISIIFLIYGSLYLVRAYLTINLPMDISYTDPGLTIVATVFISILISNLWTFGLIIMVNQRLSIENQLEKDAMQMIFDTNIDAQLITRVEDGLVVGVNNQFALMSGYTKEEIIKGLLKESSFWYNFSGKDIFVKEMNEKGFCENMEFTFERKDKTRFPGILSAKFIFINSTKHIISVIRDITERKNFENALIESEGTYRSILEASPDDITITDLNGKIIMISPAAKEIFGYEEDFNDFVGRNLLDFLVAEDVDKAKSNILQTLKGLKQNTNEYRAIRKNGSILDIEVNSGIIYNADGLAEKMVFIIRDVTKRRLIELEIQCLVKQLEVEKNTAQINSITDSLTGLFNRGYFDEILRIEFSRLSRSESPLTLIMLDIDHFKKFNDTYGHLAGDKCLQMISDTLKSSLERPSDIVARYGGEEFIVILPDTDEKGAEFIGEKVRTAIEDLSIPHKTSETCEFVTVSVGVLTIYPSKIVSPDEALNLVDEALYSAKNKGRNCCVFNFKMK